MTLLQKKNDQDTNIVVFQNDVFETMNLSDVYTSYGQKIGYSDAGAYIQLTQDHADYLNELEETDTYAEGQNVGAYDNYESFDSLVQKFNDIEILEQEVQGYTYWDGSNFQTMVIEDGTDCGTHETIDPVLEKELIEIIESDDFCMEKEGPYAQVFKTEKYIFTESNWQGHPEYCTITDNNE